MTKSFSEVITNKKHKNEICAKLICIVSSDYTPTTKACCDKPIHINHGHGTALSSSDYLLQKKVRNQAKITNTDSKSEMQCVESSSEIYSSDSQMS